MTRSAYSDKGNLAGALIKFSFAQIARMEMIQYAFSSNFCEMMEMIQYAFSSK